MKSGFTLVELSIVLVIIGLLIGGILVGQSLIDSAKSGRLIRDIGQYEAAIKLFKSKFKYYPGDSPSFAPAGLADGALSWGANGNSVDCAASPNNTMSNRENWQVWAHLAQSKMLNKNYVAYSPASCGGSHDDDYEEAARTTGVLGPTIEFDEKAKSYFGGTRSKELIGTEKNSDGNFELELYLGAIPTLALESKLGTADDNYSNQQIGLVNSVGIGMCYDEEDSQVGCGDDTALIGRLFYYLAPQ